VQYPCVRGQIAELHDTVVGGALLLQACVRARQVEDATQLQRSGTAAAADDLHELKSFDPSLKLQEQQHSNKSKSAIRGCTRHNEQPAPNEGSRLPRYIRKRKHDLSPPPNPAVVFIRPIIDGTRSHALTTRELEAQRFSREDMLGALHLVVIEGVHPNLPFSVTEESQKIIDKWWRFYRVEVGNGEYAKLLKRDALRLVVECCRDVVRLRRGGDGDGMDVGVEVGLDVKVEEA